MRQQYFQEEIQALGRMANAVGAELDVTDPQSLREGGRVIQGIAVAREQLERDGHLKEWLDASGRGGLVKGLMYKVWIGILMRSA